jgi:uncharacterized protein YjbI with pentapeptide repeats
MTKEAIMKRRNYGVTMSVVLVTAFILLVSAGVSWAYTQEDIDKVSATKSCEGCNLRGAVLNNLDLSGANLSGADLTNASLTGTKLLKANLTRAKMVDVRLSGADLTGADLSGATWIDGETCRAGSIGKCEQ